MRALLYKGVDIDGPMLPGALTRMQQHVLDYGIRTLAVLHDLIEITLQRIRNFADLGP